MGAIIYFVDLKPRVNQLPNANLITFEGIDGCGKSTQIARVDAHLRSLGIETVLLREPGGTPAGEQIRAILLSRAGSGVELDRLTEFLLFAASRAQLVRQVIQPLLSRGATVLLDRFYDSSLAYQGYGHGLDLDLIHRVNLAATGGLRPNLTILLDMPPEAALARIKGGLDRIEQRGIEWFNRVREGFLDLAQQEPERWRVIDAAGEVDKVFGEIAKILRDQWIK